jgi:nitrile hydratase
MSQDQTPDENGNEHPVPRDADPQARARALQSYLIEKGLLTTDQIDEVMSLYEDEIGPRNGAEVVARAWVDAEYREWLLEDGSAAIDEAFGYTGPQGTDIVVVENTDDVHNVVVCTLCSCYPWPVLGLPPTWYKSPPYRSKIVRSPRRTLREEFGVDVDADVEIRVRDTSAEVRYMVLPRRPVGTDGMSQSDLAALVTRDSMIGIERLGDKHVEEL